MLDGPYAGRPLRTVVAERTQALLGPVPPTARWPLPAAVQAARRARAPLGPGPSTRGLRGRASEARLKTESWYIVDADPGALLYLDVTEGTTREDVEAVMGTPGIVPLLGEQPAVPGAFHHVPAGLIHALGAGTFVAEVQTPSDTTFRIYDWAVEYGRAPRQLHPVESMASIILDPRAGLLARRRRATRACASSSRNDHYWMREHRVTAGASDLAETPGPIILNVTPRLGPLGDLALAKGTTAIVPASSSVTTFEGDGAVVMEMGV